MIKPLDLPSGAGIDYGKGDVRHFAQGDAMDVPGLTNTTRELAQRDNLLAAKVNEVVGEVNNREQFVPLPVISTIISPGDEVVVSNYRIPAGFEARVLNATVASTPSSTDAELDIYYAEGYGGSAGDNLVTATPGAEFTGEINFSQEGEFILVIKNKGALTLEIRASVMLTMRPLGAVGTLLVGTIVKGEKGNPGQTGPPGPAGTPGSGGAGSPGMNWTGTWNYATNYNVNDVVKYLTSADLLNVFICRVANTNALPETDTASWETVVESGTSGPPGVAGSSGSPGSVINMDGQEINVQGTYAPQAGYTAAVYVNGNALYTGGSGGTTYPNIRETFYGSVGGPTNSVAGITHLNGILFAAFVGEVKVSLPRTLYGAQVNYTNTSVYVSATAHGTIPTDVGASGTEVSSILVYADGTASYRVKVIAATPIPVAISICGSQLVYNA